MRKLVQLIVGSSLFALSFTGSVVAADMRAPYYKAPPPPPIATWTGCYLGANIGDGRASKRYSYLAIPDAADYSSSGIVGGGQIGCDYQASFLVLGVRGMLDASSIKGSGPYFPNPTGFTESTRIPWFATLTGRVGITLGADSLLYVSAGELWAKDKTKEVLGSGALGAFNDTTRNGWVMGAGGEYRFSSNWSAFVEYNYANLGSDALPFAGGVEVPFTFTIREKVQMVLGGLNYRFNWGY